MTDRANLDENPKYSAGARYLTQLLDVLSDNYDGLAGKTVAFEVNSEEDALTIVEVMTGGGGVSEITPDISSTIVLPNSGFGQPSNPTLTPITNGVRVSDPSSMLAAAANTGAPFTPAENSEVAIYGRPNTLPLFDVGSQSPGEFGFVLANSLPPTQYFIGVNLVRDNVDTWFVREFGGAYGTGTAVPLTDAQILTANIAGSVFFTNGGDDLNFTVRINGTSSTPAFEATITYANYVGMFAPAPIENALFGMYLQNGNSQTGNLEFEWYDDPDVIYDDAPIFASTPTIDNWNYDDGVYRLVSMTTSPVYSGIPAMGNVGNGDVVSIISNTVVSKTTRVDPIDPNSDINFGGNNNYTGDQFFGGDVVLGGQIIDRVHLESSGTDNFTLEEWKGYMFKIQNDSTNATCDLPQPSPNQQNELLKYIPFTAIGKGGQVTINSSAGNFWIDGADSGSSSFVCTSGTDILLVGGPTSPNNPRWHIIQRNSAGSGPAETETFGEIVLDPSGSITGSVLTLAAAYQALDDAQVQVGTIWIAQDFTNSTSILPVNLKRVTLRGLPGLYSNRMPTLTLQVFPQLINSIHDLRLRGESFSDPMYGGANQDVYIYGKVDMFVGAAVGANTGLAIFGGKNLIVGNGASLDMLDYESTNPNGVADNCSINAFNNSSFYSSAWSFTGSASSIEIFGNGTNVSVDAISQNLLDINIRQDQYTPQDPNRGIRNGKILVRGSQPGGPNGTFKILRLANDGNFDAGEAPTISVDGRIDYHDVPSETFINSIANFIGNNVIAGEYCALILQSNYEAYNSGGSATSASFTYSGDGTRNVQISTVTVSNFGDWIFDCDWRVTVR